MKRVVLGAWVLAGLSRLRRLDPARPRHLSCRMAAAVGPGGRGSSPSGISARSAATFSGANAINELGEVAGVRRIFPQGSVRAIMWRRGQGMRSLGTLGRTNSRARGINDRSEVVGHSKIRPESDVTRAFLWTAGRRHARHRDAWAGVTVRPTAINNRREVVGASDTRSGKPRGFLWRPGQRDAEPGYAGRREQRRPFDIERCHPGGRSQSDGGWRLITPSSGLQARGMEDLGTLGGRTSQAVGISQTGEVVGQQRDGGRAP